MKPLSVSILLIGITSAWAAEFDDLKQRANKKFGVDLYCSGSQSFCLNGAKKILNTLESTPGDISILRTIDISKINGGVTVNKDILIDISANEVELGNFIHHQANLAKTVQPPTYQNIIKEIKHRAGVTVECFSDENECIKRATKLSRVLMPMGKKLESMKLNLSVMNNDLRVNNSIGLDMRADEESISKYLLSQSEALKFLPSIEELMKKIRNENGVNIICSASLKECHDRITKLASILAPLGNRVSSIKNIFITFNRFTPISHEGDLFIDMNANEIQLEQCILESADMAGELADKFKLANAIAKKISAEIAATHGIRVLCEGADCDKRTAKIQKALKPLGKKVESLQWVSLGNNFSEVSIDHDVTIDINAPENELRKFLLKAAKQVK